MKINKFIVCLILTAVLASCSIVGKHDFASRKYTHNKAGYAESSKVNLEKKEITQTAAVSSFIETSQLANNAIEENQANAIAVLKEEDVAQEKVADKIAHNSVASAKHKSINSEPLMRTATKLSKNKAKLLNKLAKLDNTEQLLMVIIAIILPPLAVFLKDGLGNKFWIDVLLTILFYFPGMLYALWVVLT